MVGINIHLRSNIMYFHQFLFLLNHTWHSQACILQEWGYPHSHLGLPIALFGRESSQLASQISLSDCNHKLSNSADNKPYQSPNSLQWATYTIRMQPSHWSTHLCKGMWHSDSNVYFSCPLTSVTIEWPNRKAHVEKKTAASSHTIQMSMVVCCFFRILDIMCIHDISLLSLCIIFSWNCSLNVMEGLVLTCWGVYALSIAIIGPKGPSS